MRGGIMDNNIYTLKDYGKLEITLKEVLDKKDISRNKLCTMIAVNYDLVNRYYHNRVIRIDIDIIARMCFALDCDVNDILKYRK
ncbi:MAG: helix-turn-helix transcriptional regulator [Firmicutes bacterium]|nr:helix-turn-helix transcriptional regulator [Bacillota bacterium]